MKIADLAAETLEKIKTIRYDQILEKHEGPWKWASEFQYGNPEFMMIREWPVLLPVSKEQHPNITILRVAMSDDRKLLTLFLKDTTYVSDPEWENFEAGRIAICEKMPGEGFYVATIYHECFIVENSALDEPT